MRVSSINLLSSHCRQPSVSPQRLGDAAYLQSSTSPILSPTTSWLNFLSILRSRLLENSTVRSRATSAAGLFRDRGDLYQRTIARMPPPLPRHGHRGVAESGGWRGQTCQPRSGEGKDRTRAHGKVCRNLARGGAIRAGTVRGEGRRPITRYRQCPTVYFTSTAEGK